MDPTLSHPASRVAWTLPLLDHLAWLLLAAVLAGMAWSIDGFFTTGIAAEILAKAALPGLLAIGLSFVLITGRIDLSGESTMALAAMTIAMAAGSQGVGLGWALDPSWLVVPATLAGALAIGGLAGAVNAALVVRLRVNALIATLGTFVLLRSLAAFLSGGHSVSGFPAEFGLPWTAALLSLPIPAWILLVAFAGCGLVLRRTTFGRQLYHTGADPQAPARDGIAVGRVVTWAFVIAGILAGAAGWLLAARTERAVANFGFGLLLQSFAAATIGGVSLRGGAGRLSGVLAGALLVSAIGIVIGRAHLPSQTAPVVYGLLVLAAVLVDRARPRPRPAPP
jgi:ribose transport system permease protein